MKHLQILSVIALIAGCSGQHDSPARSVLLEQLKNSYDNKNWYVPLKFALQDLTVQQANWKDSTGNHSIGELVSHLIFWNERNVLAFHGETRSAYSGNNQETFQQLTSKNWEQALQKLDSIHAQLVDTVEKATPEQLNEWSSDLGNISSHNAYHTGQIIYIRKLKGWWSDDKGVK